MEKLVVKTPMGNMLIVAEGHALVELRLTDEAPSGRENEFSRCLMEYFAGRRREFDFKLCMRGTDFQKRVWHELCTIPYGSTRTYGQIARDMGMPGGARAVGAACGKNPLWIVVPCHRVVGSGNMGGYAGGVENKKFLLDLEKKEAEIL